MFWGKYIWHIIQRNAQKTVQQHPFSKNFPNLPHHRWSPSWERSHIPYQPALLSPWFSFSRLVYIVYIMYIYMIYMIVPWRVLHSLTITRLFCWSMRTPELTVSATGSYDPLEGTSLTVGSMERSRNTPGNTYRLQNIMSRLKSSS